MNDAPKGWSLYNGGRGPEFVDRKTGLVRIEEGPLDRVNLFMGALYDAAAGVVNSCARNIALGINGGLTSFDNLPHEFNSSQHPMRAQLNEMQRREASYETALSLTGGLLRRAGGIALFSLRKAGKLVVDLDGKIGGARVPYCPDELSHHMPAINKQFGIHS